MVEVLVALAIILGVLVAVVIFVVYKANKFKISQTLFESSLNLMK